MGEEGVMQCRSLLDGPHGNNNNSSEYLQQVIIILRLYIICFLCSSLLKALGGMLYNLLPILFCFYHTNVFLIYFSPCY